ncbi:hypothetical protein JKP88DRAFT_352742 [Tribonema minus]|uniref:J domain-containing protein n=1 Tax=Tribonema minus TaxID=303371 RepID=A0A835ZFU2_9STRA|nr:hypothetical protein JKP88DRAFT_352742 [Tribonema minus]
MFGPLRLGLWLALSVIRVPLSVVLWVGEACLFGVSVVIDALKLILQTVPSVARLAFRAGCLSVWVAAVLGIYQLSYEEGGELMVMVRDVARHCAMFVCAARHLPVPWGVNGVSDSQLSRAWRMFALVHHPDKNGDSSIATFVCVQQALQMLKEHEGLMRLWVLARPLLAIPPWLAAPLAFAAACTLAHWWRPPLLLPSRCLPPRAAARTPRAPVPPVAMPIAQPHFLSSG